LNAIRHIRRYQPKYIVVGVPVAPYQTVILFKRAADKVFCVFEPRNESFTSVEDYYADFSHVTEVQVLEAISRKNPNR
jgi:predicted phosphoribosyltransferase